jgi:hypothetical protein
MHAQTHKYILSIVHTCTSKRKGDPSHTCALASGIHDLHRLYFKWLRAVLSKHAHYGVEHDLGLGQVSGSALNEHVTRIQGNLQEITKKKSRWQSGNRKGCKGARRCACYKNHPI